MSTYLSQSLVILAVFLSNLHGSTPFVLPTKLRQPEVVDVRKWTLDSKENVWERSGRFEGDIVFGSKQRNVFIDKSKRWSRNVVPYEIDPGFDSREFRTIHDAVKAFERSSCFIVRPKTERDQDYVYITGAKTGCWAVLGYQGGKQLLNLESGVCFMSGTIIHEFLHTIGFLHQHSSGDRDDYIKVMWNNIREDMWPNFQKSNASYTTNFGYPYDYDSILHYSAYAFSKNGERTIIPKKSNVYIGQRIRMSAIDIAKLKKICAESAETIEITETTTTIVVRSTGTPSTITTDQKIDVTDVSTIRRTNSATELTYEYTTTEAEVAENENTTTEIVVTSAVFDNSTETVEKVNVTDIITVPQIKNSTGVIVEYITTTSRTPEVGANGSGSIKLGSAAIYLLLCIFKTI